MPAAPTTIAPPADRIGDRLIPCPSESARRRHLARCEHCALCGIEGPVRR